MPTRWKPPRSACRLLAACGFALILHAISGAMAPAIWGVPQTRPLARVTAQNTSAAEVQAIAAAFGAIADRASAGEWQAADQAFNDAIGALDAKRPGVEAALGAPAGTAFGQVEALLPELDAALSAEDTARVRTVVAGVRSALGALAPDVAVTAVPRDATGIVLAWRATLDEIEALGAAGRWIEMRNATIAWREEIDERSPVVAEAGGAAAQPALDRVRIFAMRAFAASLDQSPADSALAIGFLRTALGDLLVSLGALPAATPTPAQVAETRFRAFQVQGKAGEVVTVPVIGEGIPRIGLGAYDLRAAWSPAALRLIDVTWDEEQAGVLRRDDAAGRVDMGLPQAPTGPTGNAVLAQMRFEVTGRAAHPRDYLPPGEMEAIDTALDTALDKVRLGSVPQAATDLTRAYAEYVGGRERPGSLYASLARQGLAAPLADRLLLAVDLTSQPAETDRIVVTLGELKALLGSTADAYFEHLAGESDIPIALDVLKATDTLGSPLATGDAVAGGIVLADGGPSASAPAAGGPESPTVPTVPPAIATAAGRATLPSMVVTGTIPSAAGTTGDPGGPMGGESGETGTGGDSATGGFPMPLVIALGLAFVLGVGAMAWSARRGGSGEA